MYTLYIYGIHREVAQKNELFFGWAVFLEIQVKYVFVPADFESRKKFLKMSHLVALRAPQRSKKGVAA